MKEKIESEPEVQPKEQYGTDAAAASSRPVVLASVLVVASSSPSQRGRGRDDYRLQVHLTT